MIALLLYFKITQIPLILLAKQNLKKYALNVEKLKNMFDAKHATIIYVFIVLALFAQKYE